MLLNWMRVLESAVQEQQRMFLKKGNMDPEQKKPAFFLIQLASDKIASLCVLHLMKTLFRQFIRDIRTTQKEDAQMYDEVVDFNSENVKIPAIVLFSELGGLLDKELKKQQQV